jgi:hypothetical protein
MLYVDGELVASSTRRDEYGAGTMVLDAGFHEIRLRYAARTHHTYVNLCWVPPNGEREIVPSEVLYPIPATQHTE